MPCYVTTGAVATSEAEQALADSWQKLIMLRLKSQKLQLRQQAQPMSDEEMAGSRASEPTFELISNCSTGSRATCDACICDWDC